MGNLKHTAPLATKDYWYWRHQQGHLVIERKDGNPVVDNEIFAIMDLIASKGAK